METKKNTIEDNNIATLSNLKTISFGVYETKKNNNTYILTKNIIKKRKVYNEKLFQFNNEEYRTWDPKRSKLGAIYKKKIYIPDLRDVDILYLGASFGTTVSHISDIVHENKRGLIYAVEFSEIPMRSLLFLAEKRTNILPIFSNAFYPKTYEHIVGPVDLIFQDISQSNQINIAIRNVNLFLKENGYLILILKSRSISSTINKTEIYKDSIKKISQQKNLKILKIADISQFHKDHLYILAQMK